MKKNTQRMVVTAVMLALASVLSMIKVFEMPLGGSITLLSMLPIALLSIQYGPKWGISSAFIYALIQIGLDIAKLMSWGLTLQMWIGSLVFDYLIAFTVIGLAGVFRKKGLFGICAGVALALALRLLSHVISGSIFFALWCPEGWANPIIYSICYNGFYMIPEIITTMIGAVLLFRSSQLKK
ncbi:MAG: energy-coupled thiamine transporter ThiT, partial [Oscillospiraceae bacterium]